MEDKFEEMKSKITDSIRNPSSVVSQSHTGVWFFEYEYEYEYFIYNMKYTHTHTHTHTKLQQVI